MGGLSDEAAPDGQRWQRSIYVISAAVCGLVALLILGPRPAAMAGSVDVSALPMLNAALNPTTAILLTGGYVCIRTGRRQLHKRVMLTAFATSTLFLLSYVVYHSFKAGPATYEGPWRGLYLAILLSHIVLAAGILPFALTTLVRGLSGAFNAHRRIAKPTLMVWLYVSVTGVAIFWMAHG